MSVQRRVSPDGKITYITRWRARGVERSKSFARRGDAKAFDVEVHSSIATSNYVDPQRGKITLSAFADPWLSIHACAPSTKAKYRSLLDAQIVPALGEMPLNSITPFRIKVFLASTGKAPSTVASLAALLSALAHAAVDDERIRRSFMPSRLGLPRARADERVFLSAEQVADLVAKVDPRYRALIHTAAWTGLRWGELAGLKAECLDLDKGTIEVREALVDVGGQLTFAPPKTASSRRTVRLDKDTVAILRTHLAQHPPGAHRLVFTTERRKPIRDDNFRKRHWKPLVESVPSVPDHMRFHDLRHTHVALCIAAGMNLKSIQTRLGHSSIRVTGDRYAHLLQAVEDRDVAALDALAAKPRKAAKKAAKKARKEGS